MQVYLLSAEEPNSALQRKQIRYAVVVATAGSEPPFQHGRFWPLVLDDIASSKRRTEHRMGLRPLRRDAAAVNTPKRMTLTPLFEGAMSRRRTRGLCRSGLDADTASGFQHMSPLFF